MKLNPLDLGKTTPKALLLQSEGLAPPIQSAPALGSQVTKARIHFATFHFYLCGVFANLNNVLIVERREIWKTLHVYESGVGTCTRGCAEEVNMKVTPGACAKHSKLKPEAGQLPSFAILTLGYLTSR